MKVLIVILALLLTGLPGLAQVKTPAKTPASVKTSAPVKTSSTAKAAPVAPPKRPAWVNPLPLDSATGKVTYWAVVQVPGTTQAELYARAKQWFAAAPSTTKLALATDDAAAGKLSGKTGELVIQNFLGANVQVPLWRTVTVQVKPGRFRYQLTDFAFDRGQGQAAAAPLEPYLTPNVLTFDDAGYPRSVLQSTIDAVQRSARQQASSLRQRLSGQAADDNW